MPDLEDVLASLYATGGQAWPTVPLSEEDLLRHLAERRLYTVSVTSR